MIMGEMVDGSNEDLLYFILLLTLYLPVAKVGIFRVWLCPAAVSGALSAPVLPLDTGAPSQVGQGCSNSEDRFKRFYSK